MNKALEIIVSADLALLKKNDSNEFAMTYNFIPKPMLLGLIGAMIGLKGYIDLRKTQTLEFYEKLKDFKIAIEPLEYNTKKPLEKPLDKTIVVYNNFHGYGSNEKGGILQVKEQLLIKPTYRIFIKANNDHYYYKLREMLEKEEYYYRPYLGKNEFLVDILYEGEKECIDCNDEKVKFSSIFIKDMAKIKISEPGSSINRQINFFLIEDEYPISFDEYNYYEKEIVVYSNGLYIPDYKKIKNNGYEINKIENKIFFFL